METINSFKLNHDTHKEGIYLSSEKNGIYTYDIRFKKPNGGNYISNPALHSIEHMFATVIRNGKYKENVIYFGPMGCRTGFYLILNNIPYDKAVNEIINCFNICLTLEAVPGTKKIECGNYMEHSIEDAKKEIKEFLTKTVF